MDLSLFLFHGLVSTVDVRNDVLRNLHRLLLPGINPDGSGKGEGREDWCIGHCFGDALKDNLTSYFGGQFINWTARIHCQCMMCLVRESI
jgi:hypothetical protein